jgi:hypothetical protein
MWFRDRFRVRVPSAQCSKSLLRMLRMPRMCGKGASGGGRAAVHGYTDAVLGSQRDGGMRLDGMTWYEVKMELLVNHGEQQRRLQHGEGRAHAYPWTTTKREIGESRDFS